MAKEARVSRAFSKLGLEVARPAEVIWMPDVMARIDSREYIMRRQV